MTEEEQVEQLRRAIERAADKADEGLKDDIRYSVIMLGIALLFSMALIAVCTLLAKVL